MSCNPDNEHIKRAYFEYLKEARRQGEASVDAVAKALSRFETYTRFRSFKAFNIGQAKGFKRHLRQQVSVTTKAKLSKATLHATLGALRGFFIWLAGQPGFKSRISYSDADYFNLSEKETRIAKARLEKPFPTLAQIQHVLSHSSDETETQQRDRALIAFTILTGARDGAIASLKLKHVNLKEEKLVQDAREVQTKFSKTFTTWFFPVDGDALRMFADWVHYLQEEKLFGPDDPLFPATLVQPDADRQFRAMGLDRRHWSNATPIRRIFREAFETAGLPYFNPHSFRDTLVQLGEQLCRTPEEFKAWSQNLGHEKVMTTFSSYGGVAAARQAEIIKTLADKDVCDPEFERMLKDFMIRANGSRRSRLHP